MSRYTAAEEEMKLEREELRHCSDEPYFRATGATSVILPTRAGERNKEWTRSTLREVA